MNRLCPVNIPCPGDSPILNLSSEAPDPLVFFGIYWPNPNPPHCLVDCGLNTIKDCFGTSYSFSSQTEADLLAQLIGVICNQADGSGQQFSNDAQTASCNCGTVGPGGTFSTVTYTVPAGSIVSPILDPADAAAWIAASNAQALAYAQQQASLASQQGCLRNPQMNGSPGWICLGEELDPDLNTYTLVGANSNASYTWSVVAGALPPGVTLVPAGFDTSVSPNRALAQLIGTPTAAGVYTFTIQAIRTDLSFIFSQVTDTLSVFAITNPDLPYALNGTAYSEQLVSDGGTAPVVFSAAPADLPTGLTLSSTGIVSGVPTLDGVFGFTVNITDSLGKTCSQVINLTVFPSSCAFGCAGPTVIPLTFFGDPEYSPAGIVFSTATGLLYGGTTRTDGGVIARSVLQPINPSTDTVLTDKVLSGEGIGQIQFNPNNGFLYCVVASLSVPDWGISVVNPLGLVEVTTIVTPGIGSNTAIDTVNNRLYVSTEIVPGFTSNIYSINASTYALSNVLIGGTNPGSGLAYIPEIDTLFGTPNGGQIDYWAGSTLALVSNLAVGAGALVYASSSKILYATVNTGPGLYDIYYYPIKVRNVPNAANFIVPAIGSTVAITLQNPGLTRHLFVNTTMTDQYGGRWTITTWTNDASVTIKLLSLGTKNPGDTIFTGDSLFFDWVMVFGGSFGPYGGGGIKYDPIVDKLFYFDVTNSIMYAFDPATQAQTCFKALPLRGNQAAAAPNCKLYYAFCPNAPPFLNNGYLVFQ